MILTEKHIIKRKVKTEKCFQKIDGYCYSAKNLRNATNYIITQYGDGINTIPYIQRIYTDDKLPKDSFIVTCNTGENNG